MAHIKVWYRARFVESERGWGQKRFYEYFDSKQEMEKFLAKKAKEAAPRSSDGSAPDYYIQYDDHWDIVDHKPEG